ncbi:MAG: glycosyltransferase family 4 protein [bacterium]|nr:glycosyltransferase family 4 protein [bacterium]
MRIFMLTTSFPREKGDFAGIFVYELAKGLVRIGYDINVICPSSVETKGFEVMDGIKIYRFNYFIPRILQKVAYGSGIFLNLRKSILAKLELPLFAFFFLIKAVVLCKGCDLIHAHFVFSGLIGIFVAKIYKIKIVLTAHGSDINYLEKSGLLRRTCLFILRRVCRVIAVSNSLKHKMVEIGISSCKITVIPNGVNLQNFKPRKRDKVGFQLLWVGRLIEEKGVVFLIEALKWVNEEIPHTKLILIGEGELKERLKRLSRHLALYNVDFMGEVSHSVISGYMESADLFILPSLQEGLPLALLEAMAMGLPVIATSVGGIKDVVIHEKTGILIPPKKPRLLAEKIIYLLKDEDLRKKIGENGRRRVEEHFTWDRIVKDTSRVYNWV